MQCIEPLQLWCDFYECTAIGICNIVSDDKYSTMYFKSQYVWIEKHLEYFLCSGAIILRNVTHSIIIEFDMNEI